MPTYIVAWQGWGRGQKSQKMGDVNYGLPFTSNKDEKVPLSIYLKGGNKIMYAVEHSSEN